MPLLEVLDSQLSCWFNLPPKCQLKVMKSCADVALCFIIFLMEYLVAIAPITSCAYHLPLETQQENKHGGNYSVRISCAVCKVILPRAFSGHYSMLSLPLWGSAQVCVDSITTNLMVPGVWFPLTCCQCLNGKCKQRKTHVFMSYFHILSSGVWWLSYLFLSLSKTFSSNCFS